MKRRQFITLLGGAAASLSTMAAMNKSLALSNNSRTGGEATKKRNRPIEV